MNEVRKEALHSWLNEVYSYFNEAEDGENVQTIVKSKLDKLVRITEIMLQERGIQISVGKELKTEYVKDALEVAGNKPKNLHFNPSKLTDPESDDIFKATGLLLYNCYITPAIFSQLIQLADNRLRKEHVDQITAMIEECLEKDRPNKEKLIKGLSESSKVKSKSRSRALTRADENHDPNKTPVTRRRQCHPLSSNGASASNSPLSKLMNSPLGSSKLELIRREQQIVALRRDVDEYDSVVQILKQQNEKLTSELELTVQWQDEKKRILKEKEDLRNQVHFLESAYNSPTKEELKSRLKALEKDAESRAGLEQQIETLNEEVLRFQDKNFDVEQKRISVIGDKNNVEIQLTRVRNERDKLREQLDKLNETLTTRKEKYDRKLRNLQDELDSYSYMSENVTRLENERKCLSDLNFKKEEEIKDLKKKGAEDFQAIEQLTVQISTLKKRLDEIGNELTQQKASIADQEQYRLGLTNEQDRQLIADLEEATSKITALETDVAEHVSNCEYLQSQLMSKEELITHSKASYENQLLKKDGKINELERNHVVLKENLLSTSAMVEQKDALVNSHQNEIEIITSHLQMLMIQKGDLESQRQSDLKQIEELERFCNEKNCDIERYSSEVEEYYEKVIVLEKSVTQKSSESVQVNEEVVKKNEAIQSLQNKIEIFRKKVDDLESAIQLKEERLEKATKTQTDLELSLKQFTDIPRFSQSSQTTLTVEADGVVLVDNEQAIMSRSSRISSCFSNRKSSRTAHSPPFTPLRAPTSSLFYPSGGFESNLEPDIFDVSQISKSSTIARVIMKDQSNKASGDETVLVYGKKRTGRSNRSPTPAIVSNMTATSDSSVTTNWHYHYQSSRSLTAMSFGDGAGQMISSTPAGPGPSLSRNNLTVVDVDESDRSFQHGPHISSSYSMPVPRRSNQNNSHPSLYEDRLLPMNLDRKLKDEETLSIVSSLSAVSHDEKAAPKSKRKFKSSLSSSAALPASSNGKFKKGLFSHKSVH